MTTPEDASVEKQEEWREIFASDTRTTEPTEQQKQTADEWRIDTADAEPSPSR